MSGHYDGLGLSPEFIARIEETGRICKARQDAEDERKAAEMANKHGLTGRAADEFKARYIVGVEEARKRGHDRVFAILDSPEGMARPVAARQVALQSDLSAEQAIAKLASMPAEKDEADAAANFILEA